MKTYSLLNLASIIVIAGIVGSLITITTMSWQFWAILILSLIIYPRIVTEKIFAKMDEIIEDTPGINLKK